MRRADPSDASDSLGSTIDSKCAAIGGEHASPWRLDARGWWHALRRTARESLEDHVTLLAAGVAFFGFLSIFPGMAALVALYGLLFDSGEVAQQMNWLSGIIPPEAIVMLHGQLARLTDAAPESLSFGAVVAVGAAIWSASRGSRGLLEATNLAYDAPETRGFIHVNLLSLAFTAGTVLFLATLLIVVAVIPSLLAVAGLQLETFSWVTIARWPVLVLLVLLGCACIYHWAPDRKPMRWHWLTPGSLLVAGAGLAASGLFSLYIATMGTYNQVYGSLGAVAVLLLWLYLLAVLVLVGAELNQASEQVALARATVASDQAPLASERVAE